MNKRLAKQMGFTFAVSKDEAVGFFNGNLSYGEGFYGATFEEDGHGFDYYYLSEDGYKNAYWQWCGDRTEQDGPLLSQWLARKAMEQK